MEVAMSVSPTGADLKLLIMRKQTLDCSDLKIICNGKIVREDSLLSSQEIRVSYKLVVKC